MPYYHNTIIGAPSSMESMFSFVNLRTNQEDTFRVDIARGLASGEKSLMPKYLYDERGSELFEKITDLPEYYLTRTEQAIMDRYAAEIVASVGTTFWLAELGAGSGKKTRTLLNVISEQKLNVHYLPIDISEEFLRNASSTLHKDFSQIPITAVCAEFLQGVRHIALERSIHKSSTPLVVYFPGSTLGNLTRGEQVQFFHDLHECLLAGDSLLVSVDMCAARDDNNHTKTVQTLHAAYNDARGITAEFNLNILHRMNRELGTNFPIEDYRHIAFYNTHESRVELYLESTSYHTVTLDEYDISIAAGERIHTEYSHKFDDALLSNMAAVAGFDVDAAWHDDAHYFGVYHLKAKE